MCKQCDPWPCDCDQYMDDEEQQERENNIVSELVDMGMSEEEAHEFVF